MSNLGYMRKINFDRKGLVVFTIIVLIGMGVSSNLIYTELQDSYELAGQLKLRLKILTELDKLNSSITFIERNEKPKLIEQNSNSVFEINQGYELAINCLVNLKTKIYQSEVFPNEIDSLIFFINSKHQLSSHMIQLSLNHMADSAIKILKNSNDSILVYSFYNHYNRIYNRLSKKSEMQLVHHISYTERIYKILWLVIFLTLSILLFFIYKLNIQLKIKNDLLFNNKTFLDIINFSSDCILILDLNFTILYCNKATQDLFIYSNEQIIGKDPDIIFQTIETKDAHIDRRKFIQKNGIWMGDLKRKDSKGSILDLYLTLNSFKGLDGKSKGYFSIASNITKIVIAQNQIKELAESLSEVNRSLKDKVKAQTLLIKDVFERVNEVFIGTDVEFKINYVNKHIESVFGIKSEMMIGWDVKEFILKIAGPAFIEIPRLAFESNQNNSFDFKNVNTGYWFEGNVYPSKNGVSLYFQDITEKVKTEAENLKSQRMFEFLSKANENILTAENRKTLFQNICDLAITLDNILFCWIGAPEKEEGNILALNWAGEEDGYLSVIREISSKDIPEGRGPSGKAFREGKYYYSNDIENDSEMELWRDEALKRGYRSSISIPIKVNNKIAYVFTLYTSVPQYFNEDHVGLLLNIAENISFALQAFFVADLKKATDTQLQKVLHAIEQSSASVVITDVKGNIEYVNPAFTKLTGYSYDEVIGQNPRILKTEYTSADEYAHMWENLTNTLEWSGEFCNKKKNGELYWEYAVISPVLNEAGEITNYVAVKENITLQKILQEDQLKLTSDLLKRNHDLEKFSYALSHNIRGPLANILGLRDALKRDSSKGIEQSLLQAISDSADSMDQVIREISNVISIGQVSLEEKKLINIEMVLNSVKADLEHFIKEKQAIIEIDFSKSPFFFSLESYLNSIFHHLIVNALKFSKIGIAPKIQIWTETKNHKIIFHIKDLGIGIDLNRYKNAVFGLYKRFNNSIEGKGIGLYLVKSQVDFLGGEVDVKSELMEWTEFIISLPT